MGTRVAGRVHQLGCALTERRDIGARLENWAWWVRAEAGKDSPASTERRQLDAHDARLVEVSMLRLRTFDRLLLWWCYIDQCTAAEVCQKLRIASKPATQFIAAFRVAQQAIAAEIGREALPQEG